MPTAKISGNCGDVIYSLPTFRALGGGLLYLNPTQGREVNFTLAHALALVPLLEQQEYIAGVRIWEGQPVDYDLDRFRLQPSLSEGHIPDYFARAFGVELPPGPWLKVEQLPPSGLVLFNRTSRYRNPALNFAGLVGLASFIGYPQENYLGLPYLPTPSALDTARAVASATLLVANQSFCAALALALGKPLWLEVCPYCPNVRAGVEIKSQGQLEALLAQGLDQPVQQPWGQGACLS